MALTPQKINNFIVIDFETGGLDCRKNPVMEFAAIAVDGVTLDDIVRYEDYISPYDDELIYSPDAAKVTGITRELCEQKGIPLDQFISDLMELCKGANTRNTKTARPFFVAHNWPFDRGFLQDIMRRSGEDWSKLVDGDFDCYGNFIPHGIDSQDIAKFLWAPITETTTRFKLSDCCGMAGIEHVDAHRAMSDVEPLADLMRYFISRLRSSGGVVVDKGQVSTNRKTFEWQ